MRAFILDLDGVITDTAHYHYLAWKQLADSMGFFFNEEINERLKGVSRTRSFEIILEVNNAQMPQSEVERYANQKNGEYVKLIERITPADILPGVEKFLDDARARGIKLAVASASRNAGTILTRLNLIDRFDYIADAAKIKKTKPDPEVFLDCCEKLGLTPNDCIGFEDAQAGIEAIHAAGMFSVGINVAVTSISPDLALAGTEELDVDKVQEMHSDSRT